MLAFRHPQSANTLCLGYLFSQLIPKVAQEQKIDLNNPIHVHFIYDRGILYGLVNILVGSLLI
jgi:hypothetical protein